MTDNRNEASRRPVIGVGGAFYALLSAATGYVKGVRGLMLCPLLCPIFLFSALVFPPFLMLYTLAALKKPDASAPFMALKRDLGSYIGIFLIYLTGAAAIYFAFDFYYSAITADYFAKASEIDGLQIATAAQQDYANAFNLGIGAAALIYYCFLFFILAASCALTCESPSYLKMGFSKLMQALPSVLLEGAILVCLMGLIEKSFAHFKLTAIEAAILNQSYTDLSLLFIILRIYVLSSFAIAAALMAAMAFRLLTNKADSYANAD